LSNSVFSMITRLHRNSEDGATPCFCVLDALFEEAYPSSVQLNRRALPADRSGFADESRGRRRRPVSRLERREAWLLHLSAASGILSLVVPTWTLLAAVTAGLILGALGSRLLFRPASSAPVAPLQTPDPVAPPAPDGTASQAVESAPLAPELAPQAPDQLEPVQAPAAEHPTPTPAPAPAPAPPSADGEPGRISMEDVVSELERRYQGRQADAAAEKQRSGGRRRRPR